MREARRWRRDGKTAFENEKNSNSTSDNIAVVLSLALVYIGNKLNGTGCHCSNIHTHSLLIAINFIWNTYFSSIIIFVHLLNLYVGPAIERLCQCYSLI
jgi:hypothetical protein